MSKPNAKRPPTQTIDTALWQKVCANKHDRALAEKAEHIARKASKARREQFCKLLSAWAKYTPLYEYFPDTADLCTKDAVFRLCYATKSIQAGKWVKEDNYRILHYAAYHARCAAALIATAILKKEPIEKLREGVEASIAYSEKSLKEQEQICEAEPREQNSLSDQHGLPFGMLDLDERGIIKSFNPADDADEQTRQLRLIGQNFFKVIPSAQFDYAAFLDGPWLEHVVELGGVKITFLRVGASTSIALCASLQVPTALTDKEALITLKRLETIEPKFSIQNGRLRITM